MRNLLQLLLAGACLVILSTSGAAQRTPSTKNSPDSDMAMTFTPSNTCSKPGTPAVDASTKQCFRTEALLRLKELREAKSPAERWKAALLFDDAAQQIDPTPSFSSFKLDVDELTFIQAVVRVAEMDGLPGWSMRNAPAAIRSQKRQRKQIMHNRRP